MREDRRDQLQQRFLDALRERGIVTDACIAAGIDRSTATRWRQKDQDFAEKWNEALDDALDMVEREAYRRGVTGTDEPVFYKGFQVGAIRRYSDPLLITILKANRPDKYRERQEINHKVDGDLAAAILQARKRAT